ncbi:spectrin alpha chain, non-erythrocytic 1-like [Nothobranchius furzeri]|uniref:spectrin alpha chain, non-erythrocytic 1-like n=1 Tax=Nothobranchius furzeri TaxID=105023 RepID=UPI0039046980
MAEEAPMVQAQQQEHLGSAPGKTVRLGVQTTANFNSIKELNNRWRSLQQLAEDRSNMLGSAHEVQRFHRDADETKEWIEEKNQALNTDNYGHDLASVQALQREHEGFEHDLAALGDKVRFFPHVELIFFILKWRAGRTILSFWNREMSYYLPHEKRSGSGPLEVPC